MENLNFKTIFASILAFLSWFCVILQFYISTDTFINVISYFTVLCNSLIAISLTFSTFFRKTKFGFFFSNTSVQTAVALYIFIVFLVYNIVLRGIWNPTGWQLFLDNMLHVIIPISFILYWVLFIKGRLEWKNGLYWILFPTVYLIYSLIRGAIVNWYPYPFLNATVLGYEKVIINIIIMVFVFFLAGSSLIFINNKIIKK